MCHATPVCSGESTLEVATTTVAAAATALVRPRPRSTNVEKEKIRGSAGRRYDPSPFLHSYTRVHACEGGSKAGKRGTERMARLGSVRKIKLGRPERSPLDRLLYSLFFPLRSLFSGQEREIDCGLYTRSHAYACAR